MMRFLLYANKWDIEGVVISSSKFHWKRHKWAGEKWIEEDIALYAKSYENLQRHDPDFPSPDELRKLVYIGNIDNAGEMDKDTPGSDRIVQVLWGDEPGPVYLQAWGGRFVKEKGTKNVWRGAEDDGSWSKPVWRWSGVRQNDWAAHADWCVKGYARANHNPKVVVS